MYTYYMYIHKILHVQTKGVQPVVQQRDLCFAHHPHRVYVHVQRDMYTFVSVKGGLTVQATLSSIPTGIESSSWTRCRPAKIGEKVMSKHILIIMMM